MVDFTHCSNCGEEVNSETGVWYKGRLLCFHCLYETTQKEQEAPETLPPDNYEEVDETEEQLLWVTLAGDIICLLLTVFAIFFTFGELVTETDESLIAARGVLLLIPSFMAGLFYCNVKHDIKLLKEEKQE